MSRDRLLDRLEMAFLAAAAFNMAHEVSARNLAEIAWGIIKAERIETQLIDEDAATTAMAVAIRRAKKASSGKGARVGKASGFSTHDYELALAAYQALTRCNEPESVNQPRKEHL